MALAIADIIADYYSKPHQRGGLMVYKSGWKPYGSTKTPYYQEGNGFLTSLGSLLKPMASSAAKNIGKAVKTVAPVVGKKLLKIGMRSLKDWASQRQLDDAIRSNMRRVAGETANEYLEDAPGEELDQPQKVPPQSGSGRRRKRKKDGSHRHTAKRRRIRDIFDTPLGGV